MAADKKDKKRKAAASSTTTVADPPSKKSKKSTAKPSKPVEETTKSTVPKVSKTLKATNGTPSETAPALKLDGEQARQAKPRKRAVDFLSDDENGNKSHEKSEVSSKSEKPKKKRTKQEVQPVKEKESTKEDKRVGAPMGAADEASDEDDQTTALIQGFESSGEEDISGDESFEAGQAVPAIPDSKQLKRKMRRMKKTSAEPEEPGTVYVGRIPHGFYEHEMRAYFTQFGPISRLRISRNRTTGRSKHYAFIEFSSSSVARIVADTMDNYLMFGHILKCKYVPQEQVHSALWKGANRRFKMTPWNRIEKRQLEAGKTRDQWSKKIEREEAQRAARAEKMKDLGYEFEMPKLKGVDEVPVKSSAASAIKETEKAKATAIEGPPIEEDKSAAEKNSEKSKKEKKRDNVGNGAGDDVSKGTGEKRDKRQGNDEEPTAFLTEKKSKKISHKVQNGEADPAANIVEEKVSRKAEKKAAKKAEKKREKEGGKHKSKKSKA